MERDTLVLLGISCFWLAVAAPVGFIMGRRSAGVPGIPWHASEITAGEHRAPVVAPEEPTPGAGDACALERGVIAAHRQRLDQERPPSEEATTLRRRPA